MVTPFPSITTSNPTLSPLPCLSLCPSLPHLFTLTTNPASLTAFSLASACLIAVSASISLEKLWIVWREIIKRRVGRVGKGGGSCGRMAIVSVEVAEGPEAVVEAEVEVVVAEMAEVAEMFSVVKMIGLWRAVDVRLSVEAKAGYLLCPCVCP